MQVKKPESYASRSTRRFGGLGGILGYRLDWRVDVAAPTSAMVTLLKITKEFELYRTAIRCYATMKLGWVVLTTSTTIWKAQKTLSDASRCDGGKSHSVAKLGRTRRFPCCRTNESRRCCLSQGKLKDANKYYTEAMKGAQEDKRLD